MVRLAEGNTQTLVGVTGMLKALFDLLAEQGYRLSEAEVKVYMPGLVEKCGQPTPQMKAECRWGAALRVRVSSSGSSGLLSLTHDVQPFETSGHCSWAL